MTMEVGGLREVMSWVMGFGRHAEVLEPAHLRQAVAQELVAASEKYVGQPTYPLQKARKNLSFHEGKNLFCGPYPCP